MSNMSRTTHIVGLGDITHVVFVLWFPVVHILFLFRYANLEPSQQFLPLTFISNLIPVDHHNQSCFWASSHSQLRTKDESPCFWVAARSVQPRPGYSSKAPCPVCLHYSARPRVSVSSNSIKLFPPNDILNMKCKLMRCHFVSGYGQLITLKSLD